LSLLQKDVFNVQVAVIGAGTMGGGIALVLRHASFSAFLVDVVKAALDKGVDMRYGCLTCQSWIRI
jgi:3-hydroxyacyl-CoA dehydrogenase